MFVFSLVIDNGFKFMSKPIADSLDLTVTTVSLQATLAGIIIGIGAVVYSALADSISIRKLIIFAIILMTIGSIIGFFGQSSFTVILIGRIIQTAGLAAAETLYVIFVTKHFTGDTQKKYLGYSTAAFQLSLLLGSVGGGFISTYVGWRAFFLVPLIGLLAIPVVMRTVPVEATGDRSHIDIYGLFLIAVFATGATLYMQDFNWIYLLVVAAGLILFIVHIRTNPNAIITSEFFRNRYFSLMLVVVFVIYSVQLGYQFMFPYLVSDVHGYDLDAVSLLLVPGYIAAIIVGSLTGAIARYLSSKQAITVAMATIFLALFVPAFLISGWLGTFVISMVLFGMGFALMYAPLLSTALIGVPPEKSGVAVGFYNLTINMAIPIGIAYTASLMDAGPQLLGFVGETGDAGKYGSVMLILAVIAALGFVIYRASIAYLERTQPAPSPSETTADTPA